jgi:hypothetical protein
MRKADWACVNKINNMNKSLKKMACPMEQGPYPANPGQSAVKISCFPLLSVPAGWTEQADVQEFVAIFGKSEDCFGDLKDGIETQYENLHAVLDAALGYFLEKQNFTFPYPTSALSLPEKVEWLQSLIGRQDRDENYLERFGEHLAYCLWIDSERRRLLREYQDPRGRKWLYPLCRLSDCLASGGQWLEEGMLCEHSDYGSKSV